MINETFCNALLTSSTTATFNWQINAMRRSTLADRVSGRNVTPERALRGVTLLIAELAGLTFPAAIRCGALPASAATGYAVTLQGNGKRENIDATSFDISLYGRDTDAQTLLGVAAKLAAKLPLPLGVTIQDSVLTQRVGIAQLSCGKVKIENVGAKSSAPCTLTVELTAEIMQGV